MRQLHQKLAQLLLPLRQLPAPTIINPKTIHDTINNQQPILPRRKLPAQRIQQLKLMLGIERARIRNILLCSVGIDPEALGDLRNPLWPECALCVDVGDFAVGATEGAGELGDYGHCVGELGFAAAEFAEDFADAHALEAAGK